MTYPKISPIGYFLFGIFIANLLSFASFLAPVLNSAVFLIILLATLILTLRKLEYGVYIILSELFISSHGYLFAFDPHGINISLRIGLFIIVLGVFISKLILKKFLVKNLLPKGLEKIYLLFALVLIWGIFQGLIQGNSKLAIWQDSNAYMFFLLLPVFYVALREDMDKKLYTIFNILFAALAWQFILTLYLLFFFSHKETFFPILTYIYKWIRDFRIGEIGLFKFNFYRVFIQSQIYSLLAFFIIFFDKFSPKQKILGLTLTITTVLISLSRSFFVAMIFGLILSYVFLIFYLKLDFKKVAKKSGVLLTSAILSVLIILIVLNLPLGKIDGLSSLAAFTERITEEEVSVRSRFALLPALTKAALKRPLLGSGFGKTVTYKTEDPRVLATNPSGLYTTYAFEWGFLDLWLKIGFLGLLIYLMLIFFILKKLWQSSHPKYLKLGFVVSLLVLVVVHFFTPYLNHPLGIGYVILLSSII